VLGTCNVTVEVVYYALNRLITDFVEVFLLQGTSDKLTYMSVEGGAAFYETKVLSLERS
jgi:hypothetical protein